MDVQESTYDLKGGEEDAANRTLDAISLEGTGRNFAGRELG